MGFGIMPLKTVGRWLAPFQLQCLTLSIFILDAVARRLGGRVVSADAPMVPDGCRVIPAGHFNFDPAMVQRFGGRDGVTKAIIFEVIRGWVLHNQEHGHNVRDGRAWTYNTQRRWAQRIPFWHHETVEKHIREIVDLGILETAQFDPDKPTHYTIGKDSIGGSQMLLWGEEKTPLVGAKDSTITIQKPSTNKPPTNKRQPTTPARAPRKGVVAEFPIPSGELAEPKDQQPEIRDAQSDEREPYAFQGTVANTSAAIHPPSVPLFPPLPPDNVPTEEDTREDESPVPEWAGEFFNCTPDELRLLFADADRARRLSGWRLYTQNNPRIENPPGFVRSQAAKGLEPPVSAETVGRILDDPFIDFYANADDLKRAAGGAP